MSVLVLGLLLTTSLEAKKIKGVILFAEDTVQVTMKIPVKFLSGEINYQKLQTKVKYFDSLGTKRVLRPDDAREIRFSYDYEDVRMLSRVKNDGMGNIFSADSCIFLKLEVDGPLKLFSYYYSQSNPGMYNASTGMMTGGYSYTVEKYILQKGNGDLKRPRGLTFRKDMMEYFADCPVLAGKIEAKEFKRRDLTSIVRYYNLHCR